MLHGYKYFTFIFSSSFSFLHLFTDAELDADSLVKNIRAFVVDLPVVNGILEEADALVTGQTLSSTEGTSSVDTMKIDKSYTDLALAKIINKAHGSAIKSVSNYIELFTDKKNVPAKWKYGKKFLLTGIAGSGKTTFCRKLVFDWATRKFHEFDFVFIVPLKQVERGDTLESMIRYPLVKDKERITNEKLRGILESFGRKVLLLLDGFDELDSQTQNSDVMELIKGQKLMQSSIIVTSRPHVTQKIEKYFDTIVQVTGFNPTQAKKYLAQVLDSTKKVEIVLQFYQYGYKRDKRIHFNPMILSVLCVLIRESFKSSAKMYMRLVTVLYVKYLKRYGMSDFLSVLNSLGTIAWNVLKSGNQFFKRTDVLRVAGIDAFSYGLLVGYEDFRLIRDETADIMVSFIHPSIKLFLAAFFYVSALNNGDDCHIMSVTKSIMLNSPLFLSFCLWFLHKNQTHSARSDRYQSFPDLNKYIAAFSSEDPIHELLILTSRPTMVTQITIENVCTLTHIENILLLKNCVQNCVFDVVVLRSETQYSYLRAPVHTTKSCTDFLQLFSVLQDTKIKHLHVEESKANFQLEFMGMDRINIHCPHFIHLLNSNNFLQNSNVLAISRAMTTRRLPHLAYLNLRSVAVLSKWQSLRLLKLKGINVGDVENLTAALCDSFLNPGSVFLYFGHKDKRMETEGSVEWEKWGNQSTYIDHKFLQTSDLLTISRALSAGRLPYLTDWQAYNSTFVGKQQIQMLESLQWRRKEIQKSDLTPKFRNVMSKLCYLKQEIIYLCASENLMDLSSKKHVYGVKVIEIFPHVEHSMDNENCQNAPKEKEMLNIN